MEASKIMKLLRIPLRACCPATLAAEKRVASNSHTAFLSTRAAAPASYPRRCAARLSRQYFSSTSTPQTGQERFKNAQLSSILAVSAGVATAVIYATWSQEPMRADCECCGHEEGLLEESELKEKKPYISFTPSTPVPGSAEPPNLEVYELLEEAVPDISKLPVEKAVLTTAPYVPPTITRDYPVLLKVGLTTGPKLAQLTSQYKYEQWTFNNTVPGPFIRARVGDVVEVTLTNRDAAGNPHNVDCHAFTGPGGGAAVTTAEEGEAKTAKFRLLYPGLYVYHCAAAPVPVHISNGMYGLMYVQPAEGDLPPVDREYYVMQSEFYHEPPETLEDGRRSDIVEFSYPNGLREEPNVVVFNGSESALTRDHPLKATVGESVRIFFGNAGPNLRSSFHMIGTVFKNVYRDGDVVSPPGHFIQTVSVPPAGSTIVDMKMSVPGTYTMVDHAMFRLDKGAVGFLNVSGDPRPDVYQSSQPPAPCTGCKLHS